MNPRAAEESPATRSTLSRLLATPLRDVVRGRVTGRLDRQKLIAEAQLPGRLGQLVSDVVRRTRLFRLEKVAVAEELIAHFHDGLEAGRSAQELATAFGDQHQAGRLIGRAKRRNRPLTWRAALRTAQVTGGLLALVVLLYSLAAARFVLARPSPSRDFLAEINAEPLAAPPQDRAWPEYRAALLALEPPPQLPYRHTPRPGGPGWDVIEAYLERNQAALDLLRAGAAKPALGYVVGFEIEPPDRALWPDLGAGAQHDVDQQHLYGVLLPHLTEMRNLAKLVLDDARRAAAAGDADVAFEDLEAAISFARQSRQTPGVIADLVAFAIFTAALDATGDLLHDHPDLLSDEQLTALAHRISSYGGGGTIRASLAAERMAMADFLQRAYTDDGGGDGHLTWAGWKLLHGLATGGSDPADHPIFTASGPAVSALGASRAELMERFDDLFGRLQAEAELPLWERRASGVDEEVERMMRSPLEFFKYYPIVMLMPALDKVSVHAEVATQRRDAALAAIALQLYRRRHGHWPADLETLVPRFLPAVPADRYDGAPIRYTLVDGNPLLYCVGTDRDDDGGRPPLGPRGPVDPKAAMRWLPPEVLKRHRADGRFIPDGDLVLWPPARQPLEEAGPEGITFPAYRFKRRSS